MGEGPSQQTWWQTLPGILTATAAVITALAGALVGLYQAGVFTGGGRPAPQAHSTAAPQAPTVPQGSNASAPSPMPVSTAAPAQYSVTFPAGTEATAGPGTYQVLAARFDRYSSDKFSLRLTVRVTALAYGGLAFTGNDFRLFVDGVPRAPDEAPIVAVSQQSAKDGDVVFVIPAAAQHLVLQVGEVGHETSTIPIDLKAAPP